MSTLVAPRSRSRASDGGGATTIRVATALRLALGVLLVGNLVRVPALTSGAREAPILVNDLAVAAVLLAGVLACLRARSFVVDGPARLALAFAAIGALSAVASIPRFGLTIPELLFSLAYLARWLAYFGIYLVMTNCARREDGPAILGTLENVILAFSLFGIVQSAFLPGFAQIVYPDAELFVDWDPQGRRLVSSFLDPNFAGGFVCIGLLCALARLTCGERVKAWRVAVLVLALLLTASRSSLLGFLVGGITLVLVGGLSRRVVRGAMWLAVPFCASLPWLIRFAKEYGKFRVDYSALSRVVSWLRALEILADHPIIGVGFNTYGFVQRAYGYEAGRGAYSFSLDGGPLFLAVTTGLVGLACYLGMLWRIGRRARRVFRSPDAWPAERAAGVAAVAVTAAILVHGLFVNSLLYPFLMEPLWIVWALPLVALRPTGSGAPA